MAAEHLEETMTASRPLGKAHNLPRGCSVESAQCPQPGLLHSSPVFQAWELQHQWTHSGNISAVVSAKKTLLRIASMEACDVTSTGKPSEKAVSPTPYLGSVTRWAVLAILTLVK